MKRLLTFVAIAVLASTAYAAVEVTAQVESLCLPAPVEQALASPV